MPKSLQEILDHADAYAQRFEAYEPRSEDLRGPDHEQIRQLVRRRAEVDRSIIEAVKRARSAGESWTAIGAELGTSGQAARQRYAHLIAS